jgi:hypothetical protein
MTAEIIKLVYEDRMEDALVVGMTAPSPSFFNVPIVLEDGNVLHAEFEITHVFRLVNKTEPDGRPIYITSMKTQTRLEVKK